MRNLVLFAFGYLVALLISMEVVRGWRANSHKHGRDTFVVSPEIRHELEKAEMAVTHAEIDVESSAQRIADTEVLEQGRQDLENRQDDVQQNFADLANQEVDQILRSVEVKDEETELRVQEIHNKIDALKNTKVSKSELQALVADINAEIEGVKQLASGQNSAFQAAMNMALDAEDVQQYQIIKDIEAAYATKSDNVELESEINRITALASETDAKLDARTGEIMAGIDELKQISGTITAFEERNMRTPDGALVDSSFLDSLDRIREETMRRMADIETSANSLRRCSEQSDLRDRVVQMETDMAAASEKCDRAKAVCDRALGRDTIVMKPGAHIQLGDTGRSLVMQGNSVQICDTPGPDGVNTNCVNLVASINA